MISQWPVYTEERSFPEAEKAVEGFKGGGRGIRNTRTEMNVPVNRKTSLYIVEETQIPAPVMSLQKIAL